MKKCLFLGLIFVLLLSGCSKVMEEANKEPVRLVEDEVSDVWMEKLHTGINDLAARHWFPNTSSNTTHANRVADIKYWANQADVDDKNYMDLSMEQHSTHAYLIGGTGIHWWGTAHTTFASKIDWAVSGYSSSRQTGDRRLGYALHYLADVGNLLHSTWPSSGSDLLLFHGRFESWLENNWTSGHNFKGNLGLGTTVTSVTDPKQAVINLAKASNAFQTNGSTIWNNYKLALYPTGAGTGNSTLVSNTKTMIRRSIYYARGAIKYTLDRANKW